MDNQLNEPALGARDQEICPDARSGTVKPIAARVAKSCYETADTYVGVIAQLDDKHRVIICKDAIQWIVQVRRGQRCSQPQWVGKSYLTTPKAVIATSDALCGPLRSDTLRKLRALPPRPEVLR